MSYTVKNPQYLSYTVYPQYNDVTAPLFINNALEYGAGWDEEPCIENHFCVNFAKSSKGKLVWKNHLACSIIQPFIISEFDGFVNQKLAKKCEINLVTGEDHQSGKRFFTLDPVFNSMLVVLDPKDWANLSQVGICCYGATKIETIWKTQLLKIFPALRPLPQYGNTIPTEWQFKIYYKRMIDEIQIYKYQFQHNQKVWKKNKKVTNDKTVATFGKGYNGTEESIELNSQQGRCLRAIRGGVLGAFNDPDKFDIMMSRALLINQNSEGRTCDPFRTSIDYQMDLQPVDYQVDLQPNASGHKCVIQ